MYPFRGLMPWLIAGRAAHLVAAYRRRTAPGEDTLLASRIKGLSRWSRIRALVIVLLYLGLIASGISYLGSILPMAAEAADALARAARLLGAFAGVLTGLVLLLGRILSQIEADLIGHLLFDDSRR